MYYDTQITYHRNGYIRSITNIKGKMKHGLCILFYPNGARFSETNFCNGKKHGKYRSWDKCGNLSESIEYNQDKLHGHYECFQTLTGNIREKSYYVYNNNHDEQLFYNDKGDIIGEVNWLHGKKYGVQLTNGIRSYYIDNVEIPLKEYREHLMISIETTGLIKQLNDMIVDYLT